MRMEAALVAVAVVAGRSTPLCQATRAGRQSSSARMRIVGRDEWLLISREAVGLAQQRPAASTMAGTGCASSLALPGD